MQNIYNNTSALKKLVLTSHEIEIINSINYDKKDQTWLIQKIRHYVTQMHPLEILQENYVQIRGLGRDSSSLRSFIIRYGDKLGSRLFAIKNSKTKTDRQRLEDLYGVKKADVLIRSRGASLENYIARHGDVEGAGRWSDYLNKRTASYAKKRKDGHKYPSYTLEYFIVLHGIDKGTAIYEKKINTQRYKVSLGYYIDQFGPILGPIKCRECKDHCSLSYFTNKYGSPLGEEKYRARCLQSATNSSNVTYSRISQELFDELKKVIVDLHYYGPNEMIWGVSQKYNIPQPVICPDLFYKGKIIEFNGDVFHANPELYEATDFPHPYRKKLSAKEIWNTDARRYEYYKKREYKLLVVIGKMTTNIIQKR